MKNTSISIDFLKNNGKIYLNSKVHLIHIKRKLKMFNMLQRDLSSMGLMLPYVGIGVGIVFAFVIVMYAISKISSHKD